jgi:hypothetical protein
MYNVHNLLLHICTILSSLTCYFFGEGKKHKERNELLAHWVGSKLFIYDTLFKGKGISSSLLANPRDPYHSHCV